MTNEINPIQLLCLSPDRNGEAGAECEIILPDYCPNILRILQATAHPTLNSFTRAGDRLTVEGSVEYKILYLPEEGGIRAVSQQAPFSCAIDLKCGEDAELSILLSPKNCVARALNPQKIYTRCTVQITVRIDGTQTVPSPPLPAGCERKPCRKAAARKICSGQKPLRISDEVEAERAVEEILLGKVTFRETERKPLTDKLIVKADMIFDLLCAGEDRSVFTVQKSVPVSQVLDLPGIGADRYCRIGFEPISTHFSPRIEAEGSPTVGYDVEVRVTGAVYGETAAEWTEDAYSVRKTVECARKTFSVETVTAVDEGGSIRETAEIGDCAQLLRTDVTPELRGIYYRPEDDRLVCEGTWECRFLITDAEGTPGAVLREIPFVLEIPAEGCKNPVRNDTELLLTDLAVSLTEGGKAEIRGNYRWKGLIFGRQTEEAVTQIVEKGDREPGGDEMILYYGEKGDSVWQIAKDHACPYAELIRANGLEQDELTEDKTILIVRY